MKKNRNAVSVFGSSSAVMLLRAMICEKRTAKPSGSATRAIRRLRLVIMIVMSLRAMVATFCQFILVSPRDLVVLLALLVLLAREQLQVGLLQGGEPPADALDLAAGGDDRLHQLGVVPLRL